MIYIYNQNVPAFSLSLCLSIFRLKIENRSLMSFSSITARARIEKTGHGVPWSNQVTFAFGSTPLKPSRSMFSR